MSQQLDDLLAHLAAYTAPTPDPQMQARVWAAIRRGESNEHRAAYLAPARWAAASLALMFGAAFGGVSAYQTAAAHELAIFQPQSDGVLQLVEAHQ
jgi:hypothetical protein